MDVTPSKRGERPSANRERTPVGNIIWTCDPRFILCPDEHLYLFRDRGMDRDHRRLDGHDFFRCRECKPESHFFVVFSTRPDPHATCYLISEECWKEWVNRDDVYSTAEMLYLIRDPQGRSYNPNFNPSSHG